MSTRTSRNQQARKARAVAQARADVEAAAAVRRENQMYYQHESGWKFPRTGTKRGVPPK